MFNFLNMAFNYEDRKVENTVIDGNTVVDTCYVSDGVKPFETGVSCPKYNGGKWIIVEAYYTKEEAISGHNKWVGIMSSNNQPEKLIDCNNAGISQLGMDLFGEDWEDEFNAEF